MLADDFWCLVRDFLGPSRLIASSFRGLQYVGTLALRFVVWQQERVQRVCHNHALASSHMHTCTYTYMQCSRGGARNTASMQCAFEIHFMSKDFRLSRIRDNLCIAAWPPCCLVMASQATIEDASAITDASSLEVRSRSPPAVTPMPIEGNEGSVPLQLVNLPEQGPNMYTYHYGPEATPTRGRKMTKQSRSVWDPRGGGAFSVRTGITGGSTGTEVVPPEAMPGGTTTPGAGPGNQQGDEGAAGGGDGADARGAGASGGGRGGNSGGGRRRWQAWTWSPRMGPPTAPEPRRHAPGGGASRGLRGPPVFVTGAPPAGSS